MDHASDDGFGWEGSDDGDVEFPLEGVDAGDVLDDGDSLGIGEGDGEVGDGEGWACSKSRAGVYCSFTARNVIFGLIDGDPSVRSSRVEL
jgi:hypothetical protein